MSFFTDTASETIYPLMPLFLTRVLGAGAMSLGVIEGVAEAANSVLKIVSGWMTDRSGAPKRLVLAGYALLVVHATAHRVRRRRGCRCSRFDSSTASARGSAPRRATRCSRASRHRDKRGRSSASIARWITPARSPVRCSRPRFCYFFPEATTVRSSLWTLIPGIIVVLILLRVPDTPDDPRCSTDQHLQHGTLRTPSTCSTSTFSTVQHLSTSARPLRCALAVLFLFSLGNASDAFLLLRLGDLGVAAFWIPLLWSALHVVKMTSSVIGGALSDRLGRRALIAIGWLWYALRLRGLRLVRLASRRS